MKKTRKPKLFIIIAIVIFSVYAAINLINLQISINGQRELGDILSSELKTVLNDNAALQAAIESETDDETIARQAREKLGLVQPGERIIIDVSN